VGPESGDFFGPFKWQPAQRVPSGPKKVETVRAHPFKKAKKWISLHPNPYVQTNVKNRYIGNFMDKRFQGPFRDLVQYGNIVNL
jgi:hypothetical protein